MHEGSRGTVSLPGADVCSHRLFWDVHPCLFTLNSWKAAAAWENLVASHQDTRYRHHWRNPFIRRPSSGWPKRSWWAVIVWALVLIYFTPTRQLHRHLRPKHNKCLLFQVPSAKKKKAPYELSQLCCHSSGKASSHPGLKCLDSLWELWAFHSPW